MKTIALQELYDLESSYWWHIGRLYIIKRQLQGIATSDGKCKILNVGSGTGGTLETLEEFGNVKNIDTSDEALAFLKSRGYKGTKVKGLKLPFKDDTFDVVAALDVLEHIDRDDTALKEWLRVLKPGGSLLLTVPAYQWLWSQHDVINNHHRRYLKASLKKQLLHAGYSISKGSYAIVFSFPLVAGSRIVSKLSRKNTDDYSSFVKLPHAVNKMFINLLKLEGVVQTHVNLPVGTSLLFVAKKSN